MRLPRSSPVKFAGWVSNFCMQVVVRGEVAGAHGVGSGPPCLMQSVRPEGSASPERGIANPSRLTIITCSVTIQP